MKKEPNPMVFCKRVWEVLINKTLEHREGFMWPHIDAYNRMLPQNVSNIPLDMLHQQTIVEPMFDNLNTTRPTIWTTTINLLRDPSYPSVDHRQIGHTKATYFYA